MFYDSWYVSGALGNVWKGDSTFTKPTLSESDVEYHSRARRRMTKTERRTERRTEREESLHLQDQRGGVREREGD